MSHPEEATLAALAEGALSGDARAGVEAHLEQCDGCRQLVAQLLKALGDEGDARGPHRGQVVGRFVVLEPIGAGALGEVFSAWDSTLERAVALKWLYPSLLGETANARARLLAEARAAAKVQHPNVVTVFEVVDWAQTQVIVMELVPHAQTLRRALAGKGWREATARYVDAARGLEAAHAAGVVHGDFKPDNALLGEGRVRVCDFGLSRALPAPAPGTESSSKRTSVSGTPAYLSPERWQGAAATAATDAFALCCSLWESLTGELPFRARETDARLAEMKEGPPAPPPGVMPPGLEAVLRRGLAFEPAARFASLAALREALEALLAPRRVPIGAVVGALSVVVGLAVFGGLTASTQARARACRAGAERAAEVWTTGTRQAVLDALRATKAPGVEDAWGRSEQLLDAWNGAWSAEWQDACDDTHARAEQSAQLLDARLDCLTARLAESTALATELGKPTAKMVERLAEATSRLTAPSTCSAAALTRDRQRTPPEAQRAAVAAINEKIARVRVLDNLGSPGDAKKLALEAGDDAKRLGWLPAQAETLLFIGATQHRSGETKQAVTSLREAVYVAEEADAPFTAARAWIDLVRVLAIDARLDDASDAARHAQAYQPRVGTPESQTHLAINLGELYLAQRKPELALEQYLVAREHGLAGGNAVEAAGALANLGRTYSQLGRSQEAVDTLHESVRAFEAAQGPEHPNVAIALNNLASASLNLGLLDEARAASERAVAIREKALGPKHVLVARALGNSARVLEARGELDEAQRAYERVKSITTAAMGADHPFNADPLLDLGRLAKDRGDLVTARANVEEALALREKKLGPAHLDVGAALLELAALERAAGRLDVAEKVLARAAPIYEKASGDAAVPLRLEQGELELARGKLSEAERLFTGALEARRAALGERAPTLREPLVALARVALEQGHDAAALTKLDEAAALPGRASAEFQLARARALWKSDRAQAEKALTEARRRWPKLTLDDRGKVP